MKFQGKGQSMGEDKRFVFLGDWYEKLKGIEDIEERNDFVWRIVEKI